MAGRPLPAAAKSSRQAGQTQAFTLLAAGSTPPSAGAETTTSPASGTPPPATSSGNDSTADTIRGVSDTFQKFRGLLGR